MCFSPAASFTSGAILATIGAVAIKKSVGVPQTVFACVPFLFAVQQFFEGGVWLSLMHPVYAQWEQPATYAFLLFAQVVWPFYVPLCVRLLETDTAKKKILDGLLVVGFLIAAYLLWCLVFYPVHATIDGRHIRYDLEFPGSNQWFNGVFYFVPTAISPFFSRIRGVKLLGLAIVLSFIVTRLFYSYFLISVWCYFAAVMSIIVLGVIIEKNKDEEVLTAV